MTPDLPAHDVTARHDGVECDLTTNAVGAALKSMLGGNGNTHERQPTVKTLLYSYRVALTGIHLLRTAELEPDVSVLAPQYGFADVAELIAREGASTEHGGLDVALDRATASRGLVSRRRSRMPRRPPRCRRSRPTPPRSRAG